MSDQLLPAMIDPRLMAFISGGGQDMGQSMGPQTLPDAIQSDPYGTLGGLAQSPEGGDAIQQQFASNPQAMLSALNPPDQGPNYGQILSDLNTQLQGLQPHRSGLQNFALAMQSQPMGPVAPLSQGSWLQNFIGGAAPGILNAANAAASAPARQEDQRLALVRNAAASLASHRWDAYKQQQIGKRDQIREVLRAMLKGASPASVQPFERQRDGESDADYTARMKKFKDSTASSTSALDPTGAFDPAGVAQGIASGDIPPDPSGFSRGQWGQIVSKLPKGFKLMKATTDYTALKKHYASLNGPVQSRLQQAIKNVQETLPLLRESAHKLAKLAPRYKLTSINKLSNLTARELGSPEAMKAAQELQTYSRTVQFELGVMYRNGNAPDDASMKEAKDIINGDLYPDRIDKQVEVGLLESRIRQHAINNAGTVSPSNPAGVSGEQGTYIGPNFLPNTQQQDYSPPAPAAGQKIKMRSPDGKQVGTVSAEDYLDAIQRGWKVVK